MIFNMRNESECIASVLKYFPSLTRMTEGRVLTKKAQVKDDCVVIMSKMAVNEFEEALLL